MIFYFMLHNLMKNCLCWADLQPYDSPLQGQFIPLLQLMLGSFCHATLSIHLRPWGFPSASVICSALAQQSALSGCMLATWGWVENVSPWSSWKTLYIPYSTIPGTIYLQFLICLSALLEMTGTNLLEISKSIIYWHYNHSIWNEIVIRIIPKFIEYLLSSGIILNAFHLCKTSMK